MEKPLALVSNLIQNSFATFSIFLFQDSFCYLLSEWQEFTLCHTLLFYEK